MSNKIILLIVASISLLGAFFTTDKETYNDISYLDSNNYMDISFDRVTSNYKSSVSLTDNNKGIEIKSLDLSNGKEIITYEIVNNSSIYDVNINVLINGNKHYENNYVTISSSDLSTIKKGNKTTGRLIIELKDDIHEEFSIPFNVEIEATPIQKKYLY